MRLTLCPAAVRTRLHRLGLAAREEADLYFPQVPTSVPLCRPLTAEQIAFLEKGFLICSSHHLKAPFPQSLEMIRMN